MNQTVTGKAYEYALAQAFSRVLSVEIAPDGASAAAKDNYGKVDADLRRNIDASARIVAEFLTDKEGGFASATGIFIQTDVAGLQGDVRDVIIQGPDNIGISAKHNSDTVKNSRLSSQIDFGMEWGGCPVSDTYWKQVRPVFDSLERARQEGKPWRHIENKPQTVYLPILAAFEDEFRHLCETHAADFISKVFTYIIGRYDFYKAVCSNRKKSTTVEACNLNGSLAWGARWRVPSRITRIERKRGSSSILHVSFDGGWELSFRLHNARSLVEPSLKFDIQFTGMASNVARHTASH